MIVEIFRIETSTYAKSEFSWIYTNRQYFESAFKQIVRTGKNNGKLIENEGVSSDVVVSPTKSDRFGLSYSQYDRISENLKMHSRAGLVFDLQPLRLDTHSLENDLLFKLAAKGFKEAQIKIDGQLKETVQLTSTNQQTIITINKNLLEPGLKRIEVFGIDPNGVKQFRAVRIIKVLPPTSSFLKVTQDFNIVTANAKPFVVLYQPKDNSGKGWKKQTNGFTIGDGNSYADDINSTISVFTISEKSTLVKFDLTYDTEKDHDFVTAGYLNSGKLNPLFKLKGSGSLKKAFRIPAGTNEIYINFNSNSYNVAKGATLSQFTIEA